jgi:peptide/nickel transport system substrate-binding protein
LTTEGLVGNNREGRATPRLAENWTPSPDGLQWAFKLRDNAKFHDGSPVDAASVKRSLDEALANLTDRSLVPGLDDIAGIDVEGPRELRVTLHNRSTFFLDDLSIPISKRSEDRSIIGTGPFIVRSSTPEEIVMSTFPDHYLGTPEVDRIVWKPYPALRTAWAGMMRGEIDFLYEVSQESAEFVQGESSVNTFSFLRPYALGVAFNSRRPIFADQRVRQALNFAVDRQAIIDQALKGRGVSAQSPIWPLHWAYDPNVPGYSYDASRAAAILDGTNARFNGKRGGNPASASPARFRFTCLVLDNLAVWERMALLVQRQLREIDVDMQLEAVSAADFNARIAKGDFDAVFLEFSARSMSRAYVFWHSESPRNAFGYRDSRVDQAFEAIRRAPPGDDGAYRTAVRDLQQSMISSPPGIFLAWGQTARAVSTRFTVPEERDRDDVLQTLSRWQLAPTLAQVHD